MDKFVNTLGEIKKSTQELGEKFSNSFGKHFDSDKRLGEGVAVSETGKMRLPEQIIAKALGYSEPAISLASNLSELKMVSITLKIFREIPHFRLNNLNY